MRSDEHLVKKETVCDNDYSLEIYGEASSHVNPIDDCSDQMELNFDAHINVIENFKIDDSLSSLPANSDQQFYMDMKSSFYQENNVPTELAVNNLPIMVAVKEESLDDDADCMKHTESNTLPWGKEINVNEEKCEMCDKQFILNSKLDDNKLPDRVLCENCRQYLRKRMQLCECIECGKSLSSQSCNLKNYKCILSEMEPQNCKVRCTECEKSFCELFVSKILEQVLSEYKPHNESAHLNKVREQCIESATTKPYKCRECGKSFTQRGNLQMHERIHSGIQPYKCKECNKSFTQRCSFQRHQRIHSGIKPYKCNECDKSFTQSAHLKIHERIHSGIQPYKCNECDKLFPDRGKLSAHERIHSGIKPYSCSECGKSFTNRSNLNAHERIHSGIQPYKCNECDKSFARSGDFKRHQHIHTGIKLYSCSECGKSFTTRYDLTVHECKNHS